MLFADCSFFRFHYGYPKSRGLVTAASLSQFLSCVRIDLQTIPREVRSVEQKGNHENGGGDHEKQKSSHLTM